MPSSPVSPSVTLAATTSASSTMSHPHTIILTTPRSAHPTFLYDVQQSDLNPVFKSEDAIFFRKTNPTGWGWSNIFIIPGEDINMPQEWSIRQRWSFTITCAEKFAGVSKIARAVREGEGGDEEMEMEMEIPEDLKETLKYREPLGKKNRLYVLTFLEFKNGKAEEKYKTHISALASPENTLDAQMHLHGRVTQTTKLARMDDIQAHEPDAMDYFALLSFPSNEHFGAYLGSEEYKKLLRKNGGVKTSFVLTKELGLPPKGQKIDKYGWKYGNPYEPYGEDWFG